MKCELTLTGRAFATTPRLCSSASNTESSPPDSARTDLPHSRPVFLQNAAVHHDENASLARLFGGRFVDHVFLHPNGWDFQLDRLIDNFFHKFRTPEDIHDVDLLRHIEQ